MYLLSLTLVYLLRILFGIIYVLDHHLAILLRCNVLLLLPPQWLSALCCCLHDQITVRSINRAFCLGSSSQVTAGVSTMIYHCTLTFKCSKSLKVYSWKVLVVEERPIKENKTNVLIIQVKACKTSVKHLNNRAIKLIVGWHRMLE